MVSSAMTVSYFAGGHFLCDLVLLQLFSGFSLIVRGEQELPPVIVYLNMTSYISEFVHTICPPFP